MDEGRLARLQVAELEEAVVGRAEGDRHAGRVVGRRRSSGIFQANPSGVARRSACEPSIPTVTARSPTAKPRTSAPTAATVPAALVPDHVGDPGQVAAQPVERVAALDAHRLDVDQHVARTHLRVGHLLVAEHLGRPGLVVHRCLHDRTYSRIRKRFVRSTYQLEVWGSWVAIFPLAFLK